MGLPGLGGAGAQSRGDPETFCLAVAASFEQAVGAAGGVTDHHFNIAGQQVRLRFAGGGLIPKLTPALAHLSAPPGPGPDLTIHVWETAGTGIEPPPPAWPYSDFQANNASQLFGNEDLLATFQLGANSLNVLDARRGQAYYWVRSAERLPMYELGAPMRWNLHLWLRRSGVLSIHAGAVGTSAGGVLLVGRGGSGKSNTALAALESDLLYAADDYCLLASDPAPAIYSLYSSGKAHVADLARLPFLAGLAHTAGPLEDEKALYFLHDHFPHKLTRSFPARAVLVPRVTGQPHTKAHLTTAAAGMAALAPSTIAQLPGAQASDFQVLVRFFRRVPSYVLELGTDRVEVIEVVSRLVRSLNAGERPALVAG